MPANRSIQRILAYTFLIITMIIWASSFSGIRFVLREIDAMTLTTARMLIAGMGLGVVGLFLRTSLPKRKDIPVIFAAGLTGFTLYHILINTGMTHVAAGQASFIVSTTPIWTTLFASKFLKEKVSIASICGLVLGLSGVAYMSLSPKEVELSISAIIILFAAICAGLSMTLQKNILDRYHPIDATIHITIAGSIPFFFYIPWTSPNLMTMSYEAWVWVFYLGLVPIGLGYFLCSYALSVLTASRSSQILLLVPPIASIMAWLWLGEAPTKTLWIGGGLTFLGVVIGGLGKSSSTDQREDH